MSEKKTKRVTKKVEETEEKIVEERTAEVFDNGSSGAKSETNQSSEKTGDEQQKVQRRNGCRIEVVNGQQKLTIAKLIRDSKEERRSAKDIRNSKDDEFLRNKHKNKISSYRIKLIRKRKAANFRKLKRAEASAAHKKDLT